MIFPELQSELFSKINNSVISNLKFKISNQILIIQFYKSHCHCERQSGNLIFFKICNLFGIWYLEFVIYNKSMLKPGQVIKIFISKKGRNITLRMIKPDDSKDFRRMYNSIIAEDNYVMQIKPESKKETDDWVKEEIKKLNSGVKIQLIATHNNHIIGQCAIQKEKGRKEHVGGFGISIDKNFREEGIGTILSEETMKLAKKNLKIKMLRLSLFNSNKRAFALYRKIGFKKYGLLPKSINWRGNKIDQLFMYKKL